MTLEKFEGKDENVKSSIRINLPEDYPYFKELINIAVSYNSEIEYGNGSLIIGIYNSMIMDYIEKELQFCLSQHQ